MSLPKIGILTLQGGFEKHFEAMSRLKAETCRVRSADELSGLNGIILPGGESTTIIRLLKIFNILEPLKDAIENGLPVFGTCAGMILLSSGISSHSDQETLGAMDFTIARNDYGRQIASFNTELDIPVIGKPKVPAVFIRAPKISLLSDKVIALSFYKKSPVLIQQDKKLAASFHPELTEDTRIHEYFLSIIEG